MQVLDELAERRIREAQARGEFDDLPGAGAPLALDDDALVPEDLRVAYRLLKNAGFVPPELAAQRELRDIESLLERTEHGGEHDALLGRYACLLNRLGARHGRGSLLIEAEYAARVAEKLAAMRKRPA